jgi:PAS domain-containing protein
LIAGPLIWIALKNGFSRVSLAIVGMNFGTILAIWLFKFDASHLGELQFLMFGIYASTLLTGAIVTKQKKTEEELRQREVRNRALIENAPDAITLLGADGLLKYLSPSTSESWVTFPEELVGSNPAEFTHPDDLPALLKLMEDLVKNRESCHNPVSHSDIKMDPGAGWRAPLPTCWPSRVYKQSFSIFGILPNASRRKKPCRRVKNVSGHSWNTAWKKSHWLTRTEILPMKALPRAGRSVTRPTRSWVTTSSICFIRTSGQPQPNLLEQVVKHPGSVQEALFRLRHQDGSWRWMEGFLTNLLDEPAVQSVVINYRDITERKRAEQEIVSLAKFPSENPNPVLRLSREGIILYANAKRRLWSMWGCVGVGKTAPQFWRDLGYSGASPGKQDR